MARLRSLLAAIAVVTVLYPSSAQAAFITTNEAAMDSIFGVPGLGIDIQFQAAVSVNGPLTLNSAADEAAIHALAPSAAPNTVFMFFIDTMNWCDVTDPSVVGCALFPGDKLIVESGFAGGANGAELNAHELGHNLNLAHTDPTSTNLMFGTLNGNTNLTAGQMTTILASPLVQGPAGSRYISILPVLVTPEPNTFVLFAGGLAALAGRRRRR
jgi:hypothetical protein